MVKLFDERPRGAAPGVAESPREARLARFWWACVTSWRRNPLSDDVCRRCGLPRRRFGGPR